MVKSKFTDTVKSSDSKEVTGGFSDQKKTPDDTRHELAKYYVIGFLLIIILVLILSFVKGFNTQSVKDLLLTTSGILSGPLGFIIGYYFKSKEK